MTNRAALAVGAFFAIAIAFAALTGQRPVTGYETVPVVTPK